MFQQIFEVTPIMPLVSTPKSKKNPAKFHLDPTGNDGALVFY